MASGILGQSNPTANTNTTVYTVPSSVTASATISVTNLSGAIAVVSFAVAASGTPGNSEWIFYSYPLPGYGTIERSGIIAQTGKNFVVVSTTANVAVSVYGYEN